MCVWGGGSRAAHQKEDGNAAQAGEAAPASIHFVLVALDALEIGCRDLVCRPRPGGVGLRGGEAFAGLIATAGTTRFRGSFVPSTFFIATLEPSAKLPRRTGAPFRSEGILAMAVRSRVFRVLIIASATADLVLGLDGGRSAVPDACLSALAVNRGWLWPAARFAAGSPAAAGSGAASPDASAAVFVLSACFVGRTPCSNVCVGETGWGSPALSPGGAISSEPPEVGQLAPSPSPGSSASATPWPLQSSFFGNVAPGAASAGTAVGSMSGVKIREGFSAKCKARAATTDVCVCRRRTGTLPRAHESRQHGTGSSPGFQRGSVAMSGSPVSCLPRTARDWMRTANVPNQRTRRATR